MEEKKDEGLAAAHDYRGQQQRRYGGAETEQFIHRSKTEFDAAVAHVQIMFPDMTPAVICSLMNERSGPETDLDEPISHSQIQDFRQIIERAMEVFGFPLHEGVSLGVLHGAGTQATQQRVMMTDASVVMVTSNLLMLVHRTAKLLALSLPIEIDGEKFTPSYDLQKIGEYMDGLPDLQNAWDELFFDYALNFLSPANGRTVFVFGKEQQTLWDDLSEAMSLFIVGHEYGHHIAQHKLGDSVGVGGEEKKIQYKKEFEADIYAALLSAEAGELTERPNWFSLTGAGAVVILTMLDLIQRGVQILREGYEAGHHESDSHPPLADRIQAIRAVSSNYFGEGNIHMAIAVQDTLIGTVLHAWDSAKKSLMQHHRNNVRPVEDASGGWLP